MIGRPLLVFGAGGHGRVVADAALAAGCHVVAFVDDAPGVTGRPIRGVPVITWAQWRARSRRWGDAGFALGIGSNVARARVQARLEATGREVVTVVHPRATVSPAARLGPGTVVMAGAVVNPDAVLGRGCIVNTGAIVEHDCELGDLVHLSPNVALGGAVSVGPRSHLGLGAVVLPGRRIGADVTVGAGAVVIRGVPDALTVVGVPARPLGARGGGTGARIYLSVPPLASRARR